MVDRRTLLLDAALELVGTQGMRGLTHRAVDAAAELPAGSTSNYFRTREALVLGIVERFIVREREMATWPRDEVDPTPAGVAEALGRFVDRALGPDRMVTLARYANYVTGLVLHELALPSPDLDAATRIRAVIDTLGWPGADRS